MTGAFEAAKAFIQTAMRLRVGDASLGLCLAAKALADLHSGISQDALPTAHWAVRLQPRFWLGRQVLAACLDAIGERDAAARIAAELKRDYPGISAEEFVGWFPYACPSDVSRSRRTCVAPDGTEWRARRCGHRESSRGQPGAVSFDQLVGAGKQRGGNFDA